VAQEEFIHHITEDVSFDLEGETLKLSSDWSLSRQVQSLLSIGSFCFYINDPREVSRDIVRPILNVSLRISLLAWQLSVNTTEFIAKFHMKQYKRVEYLFE